MTATIPPQTSTERTYAWTDEERAALGQLLDGGQLAEDVFARIDQHRVIAAAVEAGEYLTDTQIADRVVALGERDRADHQRAQSAAHQHMGGVEPFGMPVI